MIPSDVWLQWSEILFDVVEFIKGNVVLSFYFAGIIVVIVINLIYRLSSPKEGE